MKNTSILILLLVILHFIGCEEIPNDVVEVESVDYIIEELISPDQFQFSESNNTIEVSLVVKNTNSVGRVWFNIITIDGSDDVSLNNLMIETENVDFSTFTGSSQFDENLLSGKYILEFYIEDNVNNSDDNVKKVGSKQLDYFGVVANAAPVISNLQLASEVNRGDNFIFSVTVTDTNGLADIENVFFELNRPDGSVVFADQTNNITKFPMFDNGDFSNAGDQSKDDGIYSLKNSFGQTSQTGDWTFKFGAIDKSGAESNAITQKLKVN